MVALRKESVDRNLHYLIPKSGTLRSLSARRAWIEITTQTAIVTGYVVALRKESVDRNCRLGVLRTAGGVALRKESVDRNC